MPETTKCTKSYEIVVNDGVPLSRKARQIAQRFPCRLMDVVDAEVLLMEFHAQAIEHPLVEPPITFVVGLEAALDADPDVFCYRPVQPGQDPIFDVLRTITREAERTGRDPADAAALGELDEEPLAP